MFCVNWFRKGADGKFLWPGYGDNSRVLKWIFERVTGTGRAVDTPIGRLPAAGSLDVSGLRLPEAQMTELLAVDLAGWSAELPLIRKHFDRFGDKLPAGLEEELEALERRLRESGAGAAPKQPESAVRSG